ncbi:glycosyl transferase, group 1/2 family protein [Caballeronia glathei]|nr:glycosyltransferase [Caballeronia glathei]CEJ96030.1 glycosyl transferase, group 1/2 family protein [Caballeronia glathei]
MKFETVIRDTQKAGQTQSALPDVSVLLFVSPCERKALLRAVESVTSQTLASIELIVIDDTSDERISEWLSAAQARDSRIRVLRHQRTIGIPAVGWVEAYRHARANRIVLAREEDEFEPKALEALLTAEPSEANTFGFGYVDTVWIDEAAGEARTLPQPNRSQSLIMLRVDNFIARNTVLIPRRVIEAIGFLDPHALLAEASEWDFWRRFVEHFELKPLDVAVGTRHVTPETLSAKRMDHWAVEEWMRTERNDRLMLARIGEYDIHAPDPTHGAPTRDACLALAAEGDPELPAALAADTSWDPIDEGYILVVTVQYDASTALYFDLLGAPFGRRVRVVDHLATQHVDALMRASMLVVLRGVRQYQSWLDAARALKIPTYYFLDDNMPLLSQLGEAFMPGEDFSHDPFREALKDFNGVLLSSPRLEEYFRQHDLHKRLLNFPVGISIHEQERMRAAFGTCERRVGEIVFAFMGGLHRSKGVWELLIPALARVASEGARIHFVAPALGGESEVLERLPSLMRVTLVPWDHGYVHVLRRFARYAPDYMLLATSDTKNNSYKTRHPLLAARLLGAVAVIPDIEPYGEEIDHSISVMVEKPFELESWYRVLRDIVDGRVDAEVIKERNRRYCETNFSGEANVNVLRELVKAAGGTPSWHTQYRRVLALEHARVAPVAESTNATSLALALRRNADELLALRRGRRYSWRHRVLARPADLWNFCSPAFWPMQKASLAHGWKRRGATLEFSDSLHDKSYHEYEARLTAGTYSGVSFAIVTDGPREGKVTVELLSPEGAIVARSTRALGNVDLTQPVSFPLDLVRIAEPGVWRVRLKCRSATPVYVYELVNRKGFNMFYAQPSPFMMLQEASEKELVVARAKAARRLIGVEEKIAPSVVDVKFIIEGDIPTNFIIQRVIEEALGDTGTVQKILITDFTPDLLLDGGAVVMSRVSSPAALPMVEWLNLHKIPYVYYIDDNFWELRGDSPVAQYYQCEPVRSALRQIIRSAKTVIVNSPLLGEYIRKKFPGVSIECLNAPFDFSLIGSPLDPSNKGPGEVRVGFAGSITRADDFIEILPAFERLIARYPYVSLVFFGYCPPELLGRERVTFIEPVADYAEFIALKASYALDIGIAPMTGSEANRYKTNNKYREYGALKIAGIYTNTSPYKECVVDGETGVLVEHTVQSWYDALERLVVDTDLRARIARRAFEDVEMNYAQGIVAERWRVVLLDFACESAKAGRVTEVKFAAKISIQSRQLMERVRVKLLMLMSRTRVGLSGAPRPRSVGEQERNR